MHTLLIVEDEKMIRQGIKAMIQRSGVPIDIILECGNGEMALDILKTQEVDVMFTDIRMPKMDGIELVKQMQKLPNPPMTVAVSGFDEFSYAVEMLRAGVREYILKPVDRDKVKAILEKLDKEITAKKERSENTRTIGCQQIKHLMNDENVSESELIAVDGEYGNGFLRNGYRICCLDNKAGEMYIDEEKIYINNIGDFECYIMKDESVEEICIQEWRLRYVGISTKKMGVNNLREAYLEAKKARIEAFWSEKSKVDFSEIEKIDNEESSDSLKGFVQMLGTDKVDQALKQIRNILWNERRQPDHKRIETEIPQFLDELSKTYEAVIQTESSKIEKLKHIYSYLGVGEYEKDFMEWLESFTDRLTHQFEDYKNKQKIQQAVIYIRENYDKDLNMAVVSNHISMNYSLFSYAFKQYTGNNFVNFLKDIRMEKAKELLENTDLRIIEISQRIGYENEKHFMKIFKASIGVSPTEYRKNMQYKKN